MNLFNDFTACENVAIALPAMRARGFDMVRDTGADSALRQAAGHVLDRVGLGGKSEVIAKNLSYGDRRALEIGVALAAAPRVLFLDEPTSGLGAEATQRLAELVRRLKGAVTMVIIEHDMAFLFGLADKVSVIHWGQVIARGAPAELRANPWVQASNLGKLA